MAVFDTPIKTNDQSVDRVLSAGLPVLLVFLEGSPSGTMADTLDKLARQNAGDLLIAQVQLRDNPETSRKFGVSRTPAVVDIQNGQAVAKAENVSPQELEKHAAYVLGRGPKPEAPRPTGPTAGARPTGSYTTGQAAGQPVEVTDATFDREVMHAQQPVLVDFWAPWCGPCRITGPMVDKLAHEKAGQIKVAKVNVDESPMVANQYGIRSIPTMMVVKNGQVVDRWVGALPEPAMRSRVTSALGR